MRMLASKRIYDLIVAGATAQQAIEQTLSEMRDSVGSEAGFIAVGRDGDIGLSHDTPAMVHAWCSRGRSRDPGSAQKSDRRSSVRCGFVRRDAPEIVLIRARDAHARELAGLQSSSPCGRTPVRRSPAHRLRCARRRCRRSISIDQHGHGAADFGLQARSADLFLHGHEARAALLLDFFGDRIGQRVGRRAVDRRIGEAADAIELRLLEELEQLLELGFGLARETRR